MSLHGAYDPDNVFAKILRGELPSVKVWEDDHVLAFMDVFPQSEGHVLIIAKQSQARNLLEVEPDGLSIMQFNGDAGGQTVFHLHFHIIPRWADRPMKGHGHAPMADAATLQPLADRIAAALD